MSPWNIIGWGVILVIAGYATLIAGAFVVGFLTARARRKRALSTEPAEGQTWLQDGERLHIDEVDGGRVLIKTFGSSWSESIEEWKNRVRTRYLTLESNEEWKARVRTLYSR